MSTEERTMNGFTEWDRVSAQSVYEDVRTSGEMSDLAIRFDRFVNKLSRMWKRENWFKLYGVCYVFAVPLFIASRSDGNVFLKILLAPIGGLFGAFAIIFYVFLAYLVLLLARTLFVPWATKRYGHKREAFGDYLNQRNQYADVVRSGYSVEAERAEMERYMSNNQNYHPGPGRQWATKV